MTTDKSPAGDAVQVITKGLRAERALVETNLRFAFMFARESVGITHKGTHARFQEGQVAKRAVDEDSIAFSKSVQRHLGTYSPLHAMKSPNASLEDRYSDAAIGLLAAARNFKPGSMRNGESSKSARFISYAAWSIQQHLDRGRSYTEHLGVRLPEGPTNEVRQYFGDYPTLTPDHIVPQEVEDLLRFREYRDYQEDYRPIVPGSPEDLNDPYQEDDNPIGLAEVWDDPATAEFSVETEATERLLIDDIEDILAELKDDRRAQIIRLRFGLIDGNVHTLDQVGEVFDLSRERIRQLQREALRDLRHPERAARVCDYLDYTDGYSENYPTLRRGDALQLESGKHTHVPDPEHPQDLSNVPPVIDEQAFATQEERRLWNEKQRNKESWQVYADEDWDAPVRALNHPAQNTELPNLIATLDALPAYLFSTHFAAEVNSGFPQLSSLRFREQLGKSVLSAAQISEIWDGFMAQTYPRLSEHLQDNFSADHVGRLFSRIIAENINDNDKPVKLVIPDHAAGRIGFLATNLGLGRIDIYGDAGTHTGAWNTGFAHVVVHGNTGDYAGAMMHGDAQLDILGQAGDNLGLGASQGAEIYAREALSIGKHNASSVASSWIVPAGNRR